MRGCWNDVQLLSCRAHALDNKWLNWNALTHELITSREFRKIIIFLDFYVEKCLFVLNVLRWQFIFILYSGFFLECKS